MTTAKTKLTPKKTNAEFAGFAKRIIRAHSRRVATGDIEALTDLLRLSEDVDAAVDAAVAGLREFGYSWAEIANRLGVTKQAAHQRWSDKQ